MRKEAIAVFNPQDPLERVVQDSYHKLHSRWLTMGEVNRFIEAVVAYDGMYEEFLSSPERVCSDIFSDNEDSTLVYVPCYPLELRHLLRRGEMTAPYPIAALSYRSAKQFLKEYPVLIALNRQQLKAKNIGTSTLNGIVLCSEVLDIEGAVVRVLTQDRNDSEVMQFVIKIVKEECPQATVHAIADIPGISMPKVAHSMPKPLHKFVINVASLGIENEVVKSHSADAALDQALTRAWKKTDNMHRDPKYTVEFWKDTEFYPIIVREAAILPVVTVSEAMHRTSGKYYEDMKELGERAGRVIWVCGRVYGHTEGDGKEKEDRKVYLDAGTSRYEIQKSDDKDIYQEELRKLIGKRICAKGTVDGYVFTISDYRFDDEKKNDVVYMHREKPSDVTDFRVGDRVRHRQRGIAFEQIHGEIAKIKGNLLFVKWDGIDDMEVFNLNDTVALHALIEKS